MSTTTDESDKARMWSLDSSSTWKSLHRFRPSCCRDTYSTVPIVLSVISLFLILGTIFGVAVRWTQMQHEIAELKAMKGGNSLPTASQQKSADVPLKASVAYVRWGKKVCPEDNRLVYSGFGAGSSSGDATLKGGAVNHLCLPPNPEYNKHDLKNDSYAFSWIYAAELLSYEDIGIFPDDTHGHNLACSMCLAPRSAQMMFPAKRTCPLGWTKEYEGYLMSSYVTENKMSIECIDEKPDTIAGTKNVTGGAQMFFVSAYCSMENGGIGHCKPYVNAWELTCVVCTI